jgi:hypothetical protein
MHSAWKGKSMRRITLTIAALVAVLALAGPGQANDRTAPDCEDCESSDFPSVIKDGLAGLDEFLDGTLDDNDNLQGFVKDVVKSARKRMGPPPKPAPFANGGPPPAPDGPAAPPSGERSKRSKAD